MSAYRDRKTAPRASGGGNPMITGIVIGVLIGLAIALAVAIYVTNAPSPFRQPAPAPAAPAPKPGASSTAPTPAEQKKFTFYDILPGSEQTVTEQELKETPQGPKDRFFLQAGSFQNEADANNLKARLALMGLEATIQTADLPDKGIWHRVRVGPFSSIEEMNATRATLAQNGIQATLIKAQDAKP